MSTDERAAEIEAGLKILVQGLVEVRRRLDDLEARQETDSTRLVLVGERIARAMERLAAAEEARKR